MVSIIYYDSSVIVQHTYGNFLSFPTHRTESQGPWMLSYVQQFSTFYSPILCFPWMYCLTSHSVSWFAVYFLTHTRTVVAHLLQLGFLVCKVNMLYNFLYAFLVVSSLLLRWSSCSVVCRHYYVSLVTFWYNVVLLTVPEKPTAVSLASGFILVQVRYFCSFTLAAVVHRGFRAIDYFTMLSYHVIG